MPSRDLSINVNANTGGAISALAGVQGAIDGITGKTVSINIDVHGGGAAAIGALASEMAAAGAKPMKLGADTTGIDKARHGVTGLGKEAGKTHQLAIGMGHAFRHAGDATNHAAGAHKNLSDEADKAATKSQHAAAASAAAMGAQSGAAQQLGQNAKSAGEHVDGMNKGLKAAGSFSATPTRAFTSTAGAQYAPGITPRAAGMASQAHEAEMAQRAAGTWHGYTRAVSGAGKAAEAAEGHSDRLGKSTSGSGVSLGKVAGMAQSAGTGIAVVGGAMAGAVAGAAGLMKSTTGLGMNFQGLQKGMDQAAWSAARTHDLGMSGLDSHMQQSARTMANQLAPAMKAGVGAVKAFGDAEMGARGAMGPQMEQFANSVTKNAPAMQSMMSSLGGAMLNLGTSVVEGLGQPAVVGAVNALGQSVASNGPQIADFAAKFATGVADAGSVAANVAGAADSVDSAVRGAVQPGGQPGMDRMLDIKPQDETSGGSWLKRAAGLAAGIVAGPQAAATVAALGAGDSSQGGAGGGTSITPAAPSELPTAPTGGFDSSKPFQGTLPRGGATGTGTGTAKDFAPPGAGRVAGAPPAGGAPAGETKHGAAVRARDAVSADQLAARLRTGGGMQAGGGAGGRGGVIGAGPGSAAISRSGAAFQNLQRQANTSMGSVGSSVQSGAARVNSGATSMSSGVQHASQGFSAMPAQAHPALAAVQQAIQSAPIPAAAKSMIGGAVNAISSAAAPAQQAGGGVGKAASGGVAKGIQQSGGESSGAACDNAHEIIKTMLECLGAKSPAGRLIPVGATIPQGVAVGITNATPAMLGTVSDTADAITTTWGGQAYSGSREVGKTYAVGFTDGFQQTFQTDQLKQVMGVSMDSDLAKLGLGARGLFGPAGAGAMTPKTYSASVISFGGGGATPVTNLNVAVNNQDGELMHKIAMRVFSDGTTKILDYSQRATG